MRIWFLVAAVVGCGPAAAASRVGTELHRRGGVGTAEHWSALLSAYLDQDGDRCLPAVSTVLGAPGGALPARRIDASMPHYGFFRGPVRYRVGATPSRRWRVAFQVAVAAEASEARMELPDCALRGRLEGLSCEGVPYEDAPGLTACPREQGAFSAPQTRRNLAVLLDWWSEEVSGLWNRDADRFGIPVRYAIRFVLVDGATVSSRTDIRLPLSPSCGRTPYFSSLRTGWSVPIIAHEVGHFFGLLDEYEALSGITSLYPKAPFAGSERSRMGVSMKRETLLLPFHHYLVLRRYHCPPGAPGPVFRGDMP
ncbi:MAG: hypothetical protein AAGA56_02800 [Myxococcota bacterium]